MREFTTEATLDQLDEVLAFVDEDLGKYSEDEKAIIQIDIAVEEIFVNIAHYAYAPNTGTAKISLEIAGDAPTAKVTFEDGGVPYDPLSRPDPDVTLDVNHREIGGLGIYMVKQTMDELHYDYENGHNVLTLVKRFEAK